MLLRNLLVLLRDVKFIKARKEIRNCYRLEESETQLGASWDPEADIETEKEH